MVSVLEGFHYIKNESLVGEQKICVEILYLYWDITNTCIVIQPQLKYTQCVHMDNMHVSYANFVNYVQRHMNAYAVKMFNS